MVAATHLDYRHHFADLAFHLDVALDDEVVTQERNQVSTKPQVGEGLRDLDSRWLLAPEGGVEAGDLAQVVLPEDHTLADNHLLVDRQLLCAYREPDRPAGAG